MNRCDNYEALISSWLDRELAHAGRQEMLDHLVRCESCRDFYREARALDGLVAGFRPDSGESTDPEVWQRIVRATEHPMHSIPRRSRTWLAWAASVAVVGIALGIAGWSGRTLQPAAERTVEVRIGEDRGQMDEARFIDLTTEVLRADRRYRDAMLQILEKVERDTGAVEAMQETRRPADRGETVDSTPRPRIPA